MSRQFSPLGGMKVQPDGTITYEFDGKIIARGVDLQAAAAGAQDPSREIRWLNGDGERRVSLRGGANQFDGGGIRIAAEGPETGFHGTATGRAELDLITNVDGYRGVVRAIVSGQGDGTLPDETLIVDSDGNSDFAFAGDIPDTSEMVTCATHALDLEPTIGGILVYLDGNYVGYVEVHS